MTNYLMHIFEHFFPRAKGHAKLIDEFCSNLNSSYYSIFKHETIKFHQLNSKDPDYLVKKRYSIIIVATIETQCRMSNLYLRGR